MEVRNGVEKDNNYMREERYIPLKDVIRRSARVPQDNPRIKNQQGAFFIINANKVKNMTWKDKDADELTDYILNYPKDVTFDDLVNDSSRENILIKKKHGN